MKNQNIRGQALLFVAIISAAAVCAQSTDKLWQVKFEPNLSYNLKSGLKGSGYSLLINRQIKNGYSIEAGRSALAFKSPGTLNPNGSKKFPSSNSNIDFKTKTWEIGILKEFKPESTWRPIVGLGLFNRSWEEAIVEYGTKTSQSETGSSAGAYLSAGAGRNFGEKLTLNARATLHTNVHFYSIFSFRIGVGYRFGFL